ncbi:MAG: hypothetical protein ACTHOH_12955, partial [Lysobacteraceae bacterium]
AKKVTKETLRSKAIQRSAKQWGFFDEASCLVEKRRTSCAPPAGSPVESDDIARFGHGDDARAAKKHGGFPEREASWTDIGIGPKKDPPRAGGPMRITGTMRAGAIRDRPGSG